MATPNYNIAPGESVTDLDYKRKLAYKLLMEGSSGEPIKHWTQGANRLVQALMGGMDLDRLQKADEKEKAQARDLYTSLLGGQPPGSPGATPASGGTPPSAPSGGPSAFDPADIEMQAGLKTPVAYQPEVLESAKGAGINPMLLARVLQQESGFNPNAVGPVTRSGEQARGIAQFMPGTAKELGVDPMNPASAIPGAAQYLAQNQQKFGNEQLAAAAYNYGPGNVQKVGGDIARMPAETRNYVANVAPGAAGPPQMPPGATPAQMPGQAPSGPNPQLIAALMGNRLTAPLGQQIAGSIITDRMAAPKPTDEIREYNLYAQQETAAGRKPASFYDYKTGLARARGTNVTVDQRQEAEFDKKAGAHQAERFDKIVQGGFDAKSLIADVQSLRDIGGRITTGKTAEITAALGPYAEALGVKVDGLGDMQAYEAIVAKLAPRMRVTGSGATSDYEMRMFLQALPGLGKTPQGNELIAGTMDALSKHKEAAAEIASKAMSKEITPKEAEKLIRELPDPLTMWKKNKGALGSEQKVKTYNPATGKLE